MAECNNYTGLQINPTPSSIGNQYAGVSTDEKPVNVPTYSVYLELDTGKFYYYDGTEWNEIPCCGDSGGGDEPSSENFKIALLSITADRVGISMNSGSPTSLQALIDNEMVTIDSNGAIIFPVEANGNTFNFVYIGTVFSYSDSPSVVPIKIDENNVQSGPIVIEANTVYLITGTGK